MMKRSLVTLLAAAVISTPAVVAPAIFSPATAQIDLNVIIGAPPPLRYEVVPAPRVGYAWAPGYWRWERYHHVWQHGRWENDRHHLHGWNHWRR